MASIVKNSVIVLLLIAFALIITNYLTMYMIVRVVKTSLHENAITIMTENYDENYDSLRSGFAGGYKYEYGNWFSNIDSAEIEERMKDELGLEKSDNYYISKKEEDPKEKWKWRYKNIKVEIQNSGLNNKERTMNVRLTLDLEIPVNLGFIYNGVYTIHIGDNAQWTKRF